MSTSPRAEQANPNQLVTGSWEALAVEKTTRWSPMEREAERSLLKRSPWLLILLTLIFFFNLFIGSPWYLLLVCATTLLLGATAVLVRWLRFRRTYRERVWEI